MISRAHSVIEVYQGMKQSGVAPTFDILHLVSRGAKHMDHRYLYLCSCDHNKSVSSYNVCL